MTQDVGYISKCFMKVKFQQQSSYDKIIIYV